MDQRMKIRQVRIGTKQPIGAKSGSSGIFKSPVAHPVVVDANGLRGDVIVDQENHGGLDQAVLVYSIEDYKACAELWGRPIDVGMFGENLSVEGFESASACVGDRYEFPHVTLEVTSPRIPCVTIAARMGEPAFVKAFYQFRRPGVYCRVIRSGTVREGEIGTISPFHSPKVPVLEMFDGIRHGYTSQQKARILRTPAHHKLLDALRVDSA